MTLGESASGSSLSAGEGLQALVGGRESGQSTGWSRGVQRFQAVQERAQSSARQPCGAGGRGDQGQLRPAWASAWSTSRARQCSGGCIWEPVGCS